MWVETSETKFTLQHIVAQKAKAIKEQTLSNIYIFLFSGKEKLPRNKGSGSCGPVCLPIWWGFLMRCLSVAEAL